MARNTDSSKNRLHLGYVYLYVVTKLYLQENHPQLISDSITVEYQEAEKQGWDKYLYYKW